MFSKTKVALSAAIVLSTAFPASAAIKHHRVTIIRGFITWSPTPFAAAVRRLVSHFAVTFARGLALVDHLIAGDECSGAKRRPNQACGSPRRRADEVIG
jgi:hypothetical protein